jgi:predicted patatin/cPLA2 family phospholipase
MNRVTGSCGYHNWAKTLFSLNNKILAIDGGGIKGIYSAVILSHFEDAFGPIHRHFNLICGTSTGGIIALALVSGIKASEVVRPNDAGFSCRVCYRRWVYAIALIWIMKEITGSDYKNVTIALIAQ